MNIVQMKDKIGKFVPKLTRYQYYNHCQHYKIYNNKDNWHWNPFI